MQWLGTTKNVVVIDEGKSEADLAPRIENRWRPACVLGDLPRRKNLWTAGQTYFDSIDRYETSGSVRYLGLSATMALRN